MANQTAEQELYHRMVKIRMVEETIAERYKEEKMRCPTHLSVGQEAVAAAVGIALDIKDQAYSSHRAHAHYIGKNGDIKRMMAEIYGRETGCAKGKGGSMHLIDLSVGFAGSTAIVANSIPLAVGAGLANKHLKNGQVACAFLGDAAVEEGAFHESFNFAVLKKLPVLFVCENNLYSVYTPLRYRQPEGRKIWKLAEAYGALSIHGDGNDPLRVMSTVRDALTHIRGGKGPVFLEFDTYRWREHCGPNFDNNIGYRSEEEYHAWKKQDPVPRLKTHLEKQNIPATWFNKVDEDLRKEVDAAFAFADTSPWPEANETYTHLFASSEARS